MTRQHQGQNPKTLVLASEIVAAYVAKNAIPVAALPGFIGSVHAALKGLYDGTRAVGANGAADAEQPTLAQVRKSITPDALISFIDGKRYKCLSGDILSDVRGL